MKFSNLATIGVFAIASVQARPFVGDALKFPDQFSMTLVSDMPLKMSFRQFVDRINHRFKQVFVADGSVSAVSDVVWLNDREASRTYRSDLTCVSRKFAFGFSQDDSAPKYVHTELYENSIVDVYEYVEDENSQLYKVDAFNGDFKYVIYTYGAQKFQFKIEDFVLAAPEKEFGIPKHINCVDSGEVASPVMAKNFERLFNQHQ